MHGRSKSLGTRLRLSVITTPKNFRDVTEEMGYLPMKKFRMGLCFLCYEVLFVSLWHLDARS